MILALYSLGLAVAAFEFSLIVNAAPAIDSFLDGNDNTRSAFLFFVVLFLMTNVMRVALIIVRSYVIQIISVNICVRIMTRFFSRSLHHSETDDTSELTTIITNKVNQSIRGVFGPCLSITVFFAMMLMALVTYADAISPKVLAAVSLVVLFYSGFILAIRKQVNNLSVKINEEQTKAVKLINTTKVGVREILLRDTLSGVLNQFMIIQKKLRYSMAKNQVFGETPRYILELTGLLIFIGVLFLMPDLQSDTSLLAYTGVASIAASRVLPAAQQAFAGWSNLKGNYYSAQEVIDFLERIEQEKRFVSNVNIPLERFVSIKLENVKFAYENERPILHHINMTINKGDKIAIMGDSGAGKSTLIDLIAGLIKPTDGQIYFNGQPSELFANRTWHQQLTFVAQRSLILPDFDLLNNVTLSPFFVDVPTIDSERLSSAIRNVSLGAKLNNAQNNLEQYSGGEKQRVSLARAFYFNADVIIMDEPTSALDKDLAHEILDQIFAEFSEKTVIIITHDQGIASKFDRVFKIHEGAILD